MKGWKRKPSATDAQIDDVIKLYGRIPMGRIMEVLHAQGLGATGDRIQARQDANGGRLSRTEAAMFTGASGNAKWADLVARVTGTKPNGAIRAPRAAAAVAREVAAPEPEQQIEATAPLRAIGSTLKVAMAAMNVYDLHAYFDDEEKFQIAATPRPIMVEVE